MHCPISILIFRDPNDEIQYKAYIPREYNSETNLQFVNTATNRQSGGSNVTSTNQEYDNEYYRFMGAIYTDINYSIEDGLNNETKYGKLLEHHTRFIEIDLQNMDYSKVYFSLYQNQHTNYLCIHNNSPVYFDMIQADNYASIQSELMRGKADVTFV